MPELRSALYTAVVCDALDGLGYHNQSPAVSLTPWTTDDILIGRCKTTQWTDIAYEDPQPYELELQAVDSCRADDVFICAAGGSTRSGVWGELLSTAARNTGCVGAVVDGAVRDVAKMRAMNFPVFARSTSPYDSLNRQRVIEIDVPVSIGGVVIRPGELIVADIDGVIVIPKEIESEVIDAAWKKVHDENITRDSIKSGMKATEAYKKYGVL